MPSKVIQLDYYFGPDDQHLTLLTEANFQELVAALADNAVLSAKIKNKELVFKDMISLLYVYRNGELPPASAPVRGNN